MTLSPQRAIVVRRNPQGEIAAKLETLAPEEFGSAGVLIRTAYSSLNYKDALAATGHPGVARNFPHVPGIDAAGTVLESDDPRYQPGELVIATGHEIGVERWGGWADLLRVPGEWLVPLPPGMSLLDAMTWGTAGFTAAQCVQALRMHGIEPGRGPVVVTGASGGVGCLSVLLLAQLGYRVVAVSGKPQQYDWLKSLGATEVQGRELLAESKPRPLLSAKFAGGIDTVGGQPLATLCKMIEHRGCIACCGLTAGADLPLTVYPFLLRGLSLCGIDSAWCPDEEREKIWQRLAGEWSSQQLAQVRRLVPLEQMGDEVPRILAGENSGRVVVAVEDGARG